jgi:hypothetical protein
MYTVDQLDDNHWVIKWLGQNVIELVHPWMVAQSLSILEDMGDPLTWQGKFKDVLQRRVWRLYRVVPCNHTTGCRGSTVGRSCSRPSGHETWGGEPHIGRVKAFDEWLIQQPLPAQLSGELEL